MNGGYRREKKMIWTSISCALLILPHCLSYPSFQDQLPNGNNVLHPCIPNYRWPGVGHENRNGGGSRNVFGQDFKNEGYQWTRSLCLKDSDGDGRTNGEELGDPNCVWSSGKIPARTVNVTHPGICEPLSDARCVGKNSFVSCQLDSFDKCSVINSTDIRKLDVRFPSFKIPASETNYMCMIMELPSDQDYHIVADQAIINNSNVLHHMLLYGCDDPNITLSTAPTSCGMFSSACNSIIGGWTVGQAGQCYGDTVGFRIGTTGYKRARLEIHYNNPDMITTYTDSSGLRLYYRPARPEVQDMFTFMTGQLMLELPPGQSSIEKVGVCKGSCTSTLIKQTLYVKSAINHMHYLGRSMRIELVRNGSVIANLTNDNYYSYDSPVTHYHEPAIKIVPGDEIVTRCVYNTISSSRYVYYGEGTSDEMCFGFLQVYPKSALTAARASCVAKSSLSFCELIKATPLNGCDWGKILNPYNPETISMATDLYKNCNLDGFCRPECKDVVKTISSHPCFQGETGKFVKSFMASSKEGLEFLGRLQSCPVVQTPDCRHQCSTMCDVDYRGSLYAGSITLHKLSTSVITLTVVALVARFFY
ncbi:hypothetical protein Btru_050423 [Bulinus truncatus]|nr:hypothetical protein Btru_050423 [Bulinus truncatus]